MNIYLIKVDIHNVICYYYIMEGYINRALEPSIMEAAESFPVVVLTGPRQTGKSTLLQELFPDYRYLTFDDIMLRSGAKSDPALFIDGLDLPIIIDEIQYVPELLSYIKIAVDKDRRLKGQYILTGSQIFPLMKGLTESLAGRAAVFELPGVSMGEYPESLIETDGLYSRILKGGFPEPLIHNAPGKIFFPSYIQTYLERDIRLVQNVGDLTMFQNFLRLLALRTGNILNITSIANDLGIGATTCKRWLSLLENTRIIYLLRPWSKNIGKRLIKSPKLYFTDTGLVSYLLRITDVQQLRESEYAGALFETFIIIELLKLKQNMSHDFDLFYFRDTNGIEFDFLIQDTGGLTAGEIKSAKTLSKGHLKNLNKEIPGFNPDKKIIISLNENRLPIGQGISNLPWNLLPELFTK